jgi:hypothetical protein
LPVKIASGKIVEAEVIVEPGASARFFWQFSKTNAENFADP